MNPIKEIDNNCKPIIHKNNNDKNSKNLNVISHCEGGMCKRIIQTLVEDKPKKINLNNK